VLLGPAERLVFGSLTSGILHYFDFGCLFGNDFLCTGMSLWTYF